MIDNCLVSSDTIAAATAVVAAAAAAAAAFYLPNKHESVLTVDVTSKVTLRRSAVADSFSIWIIVCQKHTMKTRTKKLSFLHFHCAFVRSSVMGLRRRQHRNV